MFARASAEYSRAKKTRENNSRQVCVCELHLFARRRFYYCRVRRNPNLGQTHHIAIVCSGYNEFFFIYLFFFSATVRQRGEIFFFRVS